jgi:hypothetical protein
MAGDTIECHYKNYMFFCCWWFFVIVYFYFIFKIITSSITLNQNEDFATNLEQLDIQQRLLPLVLGSSARQQLVRCMPLDRNGMFFLIHYYPIHTIHGCLCEKLICFIIKSVSLI